MQDAAPTRVPPAPWRRAVKPTLAFAALAFVFAWLLPQVIDYKQVWDALAQLDARELIVLLAIALEPSRPRH